MFPWQGENMTFEFPQLYTEESMERQFFLAVFYVSRKLVCFFKQFCMFPWQGENMTFSFPALWTDETLAHQFQSKEEMDKIKDQVGDHVDDREHHRPGLPTWFNL